LQDWQRLYLVAKARRLNLDTNPYLEARLALSRKPTRPSYLTPNRITGLRLGMPGANVLEGSTKAPPAERTARQVLSHLLVNMRADDFARWQELMEV
jgi:hypothetical protein